jgi:outer membrane lipase/esterase
MIRTTVSLLALCIAMPAAADTFVFGDSSVEQGNLYARPGFDRTGSPYYAPDGFSRESNGKVWIEHLVPGIAPSAGAPAGSRDVNFAYSGATSGDDNIAGPVTGTGFDAQIDEFEARGLRGKKDDLIVVAIGTNDFIRDLGVRDLRETSAEVITNIGAGLDRLAGLGAERVLVEDVPNLHLAPAFAGLVPPEDRDEFDAIMRGVLDEHRANQIAALKAQGAATGTDLVTVKVSKLFDHVLAHAAELGFSNVTDACYDEAAGTLCSTDKAVQDSYLFFDGLHLTEAGQRIQADYYRALLGQLDGSAHDLPVGMARFALGTMDQLAARARDARFSAWGSDVPQAGLSFSADAGTGSDSGSFAGIGFGWSDGVDWTFRFDAAKQSGGIGAVPGSSDFDGWSVVLSGERRWGDFRLGASIGKLSGEAEGFRTMPVALMRAGHDADVDGQFAEVAVGYVLERGAFTIQPAAWARWSKVNVGAFTERGNTGLEMAFDGLSTSGVVAGLGVDLRYAATESITPWLSVSWEEAVSGFDGALTGRLVDNSGSDITRSYDLGGGAGELRLGADIDLGRQATLSLVGWATTDDDTGAYARVGWRF